MGHTKPQDLADLKTELQQIEKLPGLIHKKPGIFYYKSTSFLHFHDKDGKRWAHIKIDKDWQELDIDFTASKTTKAQFIKQVLLAYKKISGP